MFKLNIANTILRYYLMMVIAIIAVYTMQMWLVAVAMAVAVSAILGYRFVEPDKKDSKMVHIKHSPQKARRKAS